MGTYKELIMSEPWDIEEMHDVTPGQYLRTGDISSIIDEYLCEHPDTAVRDYIGASSIGHPCERKIWYGYKTTPGLPTEPQMQRTFDIGHKLEGLIKEYLVAAGYWVKDALGSFYDEDIPEIQGHCDGVIVINNQSYILEIKTARDSSFNVFVKGGLRKWYPIYYTQVQTYMGMSGIHGAFVLAINKDTSKLHDEYVAFDAQHYEEVKMKAKRILTYDEPPPKINNNPCFFTCRMCAYRELCHG
jgi:hypothetical protein